MAQAIWKFALAEASSLRYQAAQEVTLQMPLNARTLAVQVQRDLVQLWAAVDLGAVTEARRFVLVGTGHPEVNIELQRLCYLGTVQLSDGAYVYHVFER